MNFSRVFDLLRILRRVFVGLDGNFDGNFWRRIDERILKFLFPLFQECLYIELNFVLI